MVRDKSWFRFINQQFNFKLSTRLIRGVCVKNEGLFTISESGNNQQMHLCVMCHYWIIWTGTERQNRVIRADREAMEMEDK